MGLGATLSNLGIDVEMVDLERAIQRYVNELGLELPKIVKQTFRLLMKDVMDITAPKNLAQGRKAVARDINRAVYLIDYTKIKAKLLRQAVQDREYDVVKAIFSRKKMGDWKKISQLVPFDPSLHANARDARGRVRRWKGVATLDRQAHSKYVRQTQKHVGYSRSGWAPGARLAGSSVPSWVGRHGTPPGRASSQLAQTERPSITAIHQGKTTNSIPRGKIQGAIARRAKTMNKDVDQVLRGRASRYFD